MAGTTPPSGLVADELFLVLSNTGISPTVMGSGLIVPQGVDYFIAASIQASNPSSSIVFYLKYPSTVSALTTSTRTNSIATIYNATTDFLIGGYNAGANRWSGVIDEVRLSRAVLAPAQLLVSPGLAPPSPYQTWRSTYFSSTELENPALEADVWGQFADPDLDGCVNLLEYALGSPPTNVSSVFRPYAAMDQAGQLTLTFQHIADSALKYEIFATSNLSDWGSPVWSSTGAQNTGGQCHGYGQWHISTRPALPSPRCRTTCSQPLRGIQLVAGQISHFNPPWSTPSY